MLGLKQLGIFLLVILLLLTLTIGAYAASSYIANEIQPNDSNAANGKSESIVGDGIRTNGVPTPIKNLKDPIDPSQIRAIINKRPKPPVHEPPELPRDER